MHGLRFGILSLALCAALGCGGRGGSAATLPNGHKVAIMVYSDRGIAPGTPENKAAQINQLADYMENDLIEILHSTGYDAALVASADTPTDTGRYLLRTKIVNYNAGSKAARMLVGWGAGSARLDTHYELVGPNGSVYVAGAPSVATGRTDWQHVARKVNLETVDAVNNRLRQSL